MESEITLKSIDWKEGKNDKGWPWKKVQLDPGQNEGFVLSAFDNQIPDDVMELINKLKSGDVLKVSYESALRNGMQMMTKENPPRRIMNLKRIIEYEPAQDTPAKPTSGDEKMTKADWAAKDRRIARESCLASASRALQGSTGLIPRDVVQMAKEFEAYVYGEDNDETNPDSN